MTHASQESRNHFPHCNGANTTPFLMQGKERAVRPPLTESIGNAVVKNVLEPHDQSTTRGFKTQAHVPQMLNHPTRWATTSTTRSSAQGVKHMVSGELYAVSRYVVMKPRAPLSKWLSQFGMSCSQLITGFGRVCGERGGSKALKRSR